MRFKTAVADFPKVCCDCASHLRLCIVQSLSWKLLAEFVVAVGLGIVFKQVLERKHRMEFS